MAWCSEWAGGGFLAEDMKYILRDLVVALQERWAAIGVSVSWSPLSTPCVPGDFVGMWVGSPRTGGYSNFGSLLPTIRRNIEDLLAYDESYTFWYNVSGVYWCKGASDRTRWADLAEVLGDGSYGDAWIESAAVESPADLSPWRQCKEALERLVWPAAPLLPIGYPQVDRYEAGWVPRTGVGIFERFGASDGSARRSVDGLSVEEWTFGTGQYVGAVLQGILVIQIAACNNSTAAEVGLVDATLFPDEPGNLNIIAIPEGSLAESFEAIDGGATWPALGADTVLRTLYWVTEGAVDAAWPWTTSELAADIDSSETEISVPGGDGELFPQPVLAPGSYPNGDFVIRVGDVGAPVLEDMSVTVRDGDFMTVSRGWGGSTPTAYPAGTRVFLNEAAFGIEIDKYVAAKVAVYESGGMSWIDGGGIIDAQANREFGMSNGSALLEFEQCSRMYLTLAGILSVG